MVQAVLAAFPGARLGEIHTAAPARRLRSAASGGERDDVADDEQPAEADGEDMAAEDDVGLD